MPLCDVPGCDNHRARGHRLCRQCFAALPRDLRSNLLNAWFARPRRTVAYRQYLADAGKARRERASAADPQATYHRTARQLGERD